MFTTLRARWIVENGKLRMTWAAIPATPVIDATTDAQEHLASLPRAA